MRLISLFGLLLLFAVSCSSSYQPRGEFTNGYYETRKGAREYKVGFKGGNNMGYEEVRQMLFLRCSELTLNEGYSHFVIQEQDRNETSRDMDPGITMSQKEATAVIYMADKEELKPEELRKAINANEFWKENDPENQGSNESESFLGF